MGDIVRAYSGAPLKTTIAAGITGTPASVTIAVVTGWPIGAPFTIVVDSGLSTEEKILGTRSGTTFTITTRGYDGTSSQNHAANCQVYPVALTAVEATATNLLTSTLTTQGDIIIADASGNPVRLSRGTAGQVLEAGAATLAWGEVDTAGIADGAVTTSKILDANVTLAKLAAEQWTDFTPTLTQSATVTKTVTYARYIKVGRMVTVSMRLDVTGAGTASNAIVIGLPAFAPVGGVDHPMGMGWLFDASGPFQHPFHAVLASSTTFKLLNVTNAIAVTHLLPAALASPDVILATFTYESTT